MRNAGYVQKQIMRPTNAQKYSNKLSPIKFYSRNHNKYKRKIPTIGSTTQEAKQTQKVTNI